ncbi:hypothetical protein pb186bvf_011332 [Paramecium bursaria]
MYFFYIKTFFFLLEILLIFWVLLVILGRLVAFQTTIQ